MSTTNIEVDEELIGIRQLDLLQALFEEILIPNQVMIETSASVQPRSWIRQQSLSRPLLPATQRPTLGPGEREAICLAIEVQAPAILLDDEPARKLALPKLLSQIECHFRDLVPTPE